jgi:ribA/ribD-fused uncharacterized protein
MGNFEFSNFLALDEPIVFDGIAMGTLEHVYQGLKTTIPAEREAIFKALTPGKAKRLGDKVTLRADWNEIKVEIMDCLLRIKFKTGNEWRNRLDATKGSDLVEWNWWHDNFWGACECAECETIEGRNVLGRLLMKIRDEDT